MLQQLSCDLQLLGDIVRSSLRQRGWLKRGQARFWYYRTREGIALKLRRDVCDSLIFAEVWWLNAYLKGLKGLKDGAVVLDAGAHIGLFSIFVASKFVGVRVFAFEPEPSNFALLKENIKNNYLQDKIFPFKVALAAESRGRVKFFAHPDNLGMHTLAMSGKGSSKTVKEASSFEADTVTLEEIFKKNKLPRCDLLKMDCEGCEYPVLLSTPESVLKKIGCLTLEYHPGGDIQEVGHRLERVGFKTRFDQVVQNWMGGWMVHAPLLKAWRDA
ncbi:hypothetical protein COT70_00905 [candidate division WWE3 bacterium CG09_land_8_20_14_0_10_47_33]|uniref:Methyltransferase FkbM domain-containing protein n=1 Tax=candidate division WWE3 bacterium CG_4_9_14_0_2_um_filter_48_10 TaxID=1975078 RepID=A0A2M8EJ58_UNCKA|nr:MAG: hypothetical protein COT70_00905 [candidate division WWE3 bacterium CG09_land_8_20_14_0_10_47_33]PJC22750.1 MAG: hypothetical protein CO059_01735 [candidate division WWE3 bacterium CG_4_9_14_0_2_um_filter_48_10]PJE50572.1 MAG: hypothetical protein COV28_02990 [candidate division WWE3 bacterium CG10_big_fil_rev_8_21_14_0_10_48_23]